MLKKHENKFNNLNRRYRIPQVSNLSYDNVIFNYSHRALTVLRLRKCFWQEVYVSVSHLRLLIHWILSVLLNYSIVTF